MTEAIKLPGTEMEVIEKYPLSRRLDHPNFGDVCKTTFAKGVIKEFKKLTDDPITVKSRVKVTGDFGESDYIPLFYHPKAQYWDDELAIPPVLATDFDEELGCHKQAWQSFRCGDEVAVMLKEGVPVAVLGFADGVPRVGEDIIKLTTESIETSFDYEEDDAQIINETWPDAFLQASQIKFYGQGEKGLDGLDLKLVLPIECHKGTELSEESSSWLADFGMWVGFVPPAPDPDAPYGTTLACQGGSCEIAGIGLGSASVHKKNIALWIIKIGAIAYIVYGLWRHLYNVTATGYTTGAGDPDGVLVQKQNIYIIERLMAKAAVYKEDLVPTVITSLGSFTIAEAMALPSDEDWWPVDITGVTYQEQLSAKLKKLTSFDTKSLDDVQWLTRPHTKAELKAVGMWPAEQA